MSLRPSGSIEVKQIDQEAPEGLPPFNRNDGIVILEAPRTVYTVNDRGMVIELPEGRIELPLYWYSRPRSSWEQDLKAFYASLMTAMLQLQRRGRLFDNTLSVLNFFFKVPDPKVVQGLLGVVGMSVSEPCAFALRLS